MLSESEITGVILAGGQSRRIGKNKAFLELHGQPFLLHVAASLTALFPTTYISASPYTARDYSLLDLPLIVDHFPDAGPLAGIHAGLCVTATPYIFVASCDMPLLSTELIQHIVRCAPPDSVTIVSHKDRLYPLLGIYPRHIQPLLEFFLRKGEKRVLDFLPLLPPEYYTILEFSGNENNLRNINTFSDYAQISRMR